MSEEQSISQQASVAPEQANLKRAIQMKMFTNDEQKRRVAYKNVQEPIGQIVGEIFSVKRQTREMKDGSTAEFVSAIGDFEAVVYETGEVFTSTSAYLPTYFLETVEEFQKLGAKAMDVALEIVLVPTGKSIPISYEVRPLIARQPQSGVNRMKAALQAAGRLHEKLPPPAPLTALPGEVLEIAHQEPEDEGNDQVTQEPESDEPPSPRQRRERQPA